VSRGLPVLIAYMNGPNPGHAVVTTAASYQPTASGAMVMSIIGRDPWPSSENRRKQRKGRVCRGIARFCHAQLFEH
jgi:hypothetical protein